MTIVDKALDWVGNRIARRLADKRKPTSRTPLRTDIVMMQRVLRPADVLLVDGEGKISSAIRYLTQSSWSHAAIYVGDILESCTEGGERHRLIEANVGEGVVSAPLSKYTHFPTRICPVNLTPEDRDLVINFMKQRIGLTTICATSSTCCVTSFRSRPCPNGGAGACWLLAPATRRAPFVRR